MPARLEIEGGVPLRGSVRVSAAKNAALPALAAALLTPEPVVLTNAPALADVRTMAKLLETLGGTVVHEGGELRARVPRVTNDLAPYELVSTMRASVLVLGPLVARHGSARVALPGGCAIGVRPIDQHLKGLARLGAEVTIENGYVIASRSRTSCPTTSRRCSRSLRRSGWRSRSVRRRCACAGPSGRAPPT